MQISSGAFDYNTAIKQAIKATAKQGLEVLYPSGHKDKIDVAIRRAALTGVNQTCGQLQLQRMNEMECDLVETTAHAGARESHAVWQGRVFSRSGTHPKYPDFYASTGYGTGAGLCGWNCRHNFFPFFEGISERAYSNKELKEFSENKVIYQDNEYSDYEASQIQRKFERDIRATKRELAGLDAAIKEIDAVDLKNSLQTEFNAAAVKLKAQEAKLNDFLEQTERLMQNERTQVIGFGRSASQKAVWANKKELQKQLEHDIIKEIKKCGIQGVIHLEPTKIDVASIGFDDLHINKDRKHNITEVEAKNFITNAKISSTVWNGKFERYYSQDGAAYVNVKTGIIRTAYGKDEFGEDVLSLMEVLKNMEDRIICPLVDNEIEDIDCLENIDVVEGLIAEQSIPSKYKLKDTWKDICKACKYHKY